MPAQRRYCAFISYRHADNAKEGRRWAEWLHRALERYVVPPDLVGTPNLRGEAIAGSLYPIFRDEDELPANADLATGIRAALELSDYLIVLCSPRSAVSPWVRNEVKEFKELGRSDRILAVMLAGEPNADDPAKVRQGILPEEECFCQELRYGMVKADGTLDWTARTEPLAADLRPGGLRAEGFVSAEAYREHLTLNSALAAEKIRELAETYHARLELGVLKIIAGLLGVGLGGLTERDAAHRATLAEKEAHRQREFADRLKKRNRILTAAALVILLLAAGAVAQWQRAETARKSAASNEIAAREAAAEAKKQAEIANENRRQAEAGQEAARTELYRSNILLADAQVHEGKAELAEDGLWSAPEKRRGWEWGFLLAQCNRDLGRFTANPGEYVSSTNSPNGRVGIYWQNHEPAGPGEKAQPTKLWILHLADDGTAQKHELEVPGAVISVEASADSNRVLLVTEKKWNLYDGTMEKLIASGEVESGTAGGFIDSGGRLFIVASEKSWSLLEENNSVVKIRKTTKGDFNWSRIVGDGRGKYWAMLDRLSGAVEVYGAQEGKIGSTELAFPSDAAFSPDGQRLAAVGREEALVVWDAHKGKKAFVKKAQGIAVNRSASGECTVAWSKSQLLMANSHGLWSWAMATDGQLDDDPQQVALHGMPVSIAANEKWIALGLRSGQIELIDGESLQPEGLLAGHDGWPDHLRVAGDTLFSVGLDGTLRVWKMEPETWVSEGEATNWPGDFPWQEAATSQSPDALPDKEYRLFNRAHGGFAMAVCHSAALGRMASTGGDKQVRVWEEASQRILLTIPGLSEMGTAVAFDRTGTMLGAKALLAQGFICNAVWHAWPYRREDFGSPGVDWRPAFQKWKEQRFLQWWKSTGIIRLPPSPSS